jgi:hypothetical protein
MSGWGISTDAGGNLYMVTGNSDPNAPTYDGVSNIQESVVKLSPDLSGVLSVFTPSNYFPLDQGDLDFGSGGVLIVPPWLGSGGNQLAAVAGKDGRLFLMNQLSLGGYTPGGPDKVLDTKQIGGCWCGPTFFYGPDNIGRIVSSGGSTIGLYTIQTSPTPNLALAASASIINGQDGGTFTTVSSNGTSLGSAVIWAIGRPTGSGANPTQVLLYAFSTGTCGCTLASIRPPLAAGTWPNVSNANANIVPTVANGKVYVASYKVLNIFGLPSPGVAAAQEVSRQVPPIETGAVTGHLAGRSGTNLTLITATGNSITVNAAKAMDQELVAVLVIGQPYSVTGSFDTNGVLHAETISRAKP